MAEEHDVLTQQMETVSDQVSSLTKAVESLTTSVAPMVEKENKANETARAEQAEQQMFSKFMKQLDSEGYVVQKQGSLAGDAGTKVAVTPDSPAAQQAYIQGQLGATAPVASVKGEKDDDEEEDMVMEAEHDEEEEIIEEGDNDDDDEVDTDDYALKG